MHAFPAFFPLAGRTVIVAGGGPGAEARARLFADSPAHVRRLTGAAALDPGAYAGAVLAFIADADADFCAAAAAAARQAGTVVNVFDRPLLSDFHTPAIVDRGPVVAAVGTTGAAPVLAQLLRVELEARIPPATGRIAHLLGERREALKAAFPDLAARRAFVRAALERREAEDAAWLDGAIAAGWRALGKVSLVILPEADDLLSLRAARALNIADVICGAGAGPALVARHARRDVERLEAGDAAALASLARQGRLVVVLDAPPGLEEELLREGVEVESVAPAPA
jgi:precorrin-2 dehydrogenase/sirohydrochlorin ferrochelatase